MSKIILTEQSSTPATPTSAKVTIYVGTNGLIKSVDDTGLVTEYAAGVTPEQVQDIVALLLPVEPE
jgi:hypothetical protein